MKKLKNSELSWTFCLECHGSGKKRRRVRKKVKLSYQRDLAEFKKNKEGGKAPLPPKGHLESCTNCDGSGLIRANYSPKPDTENYPHVAIVGGGIGGVALALACKHRGIPFTLFERDSGFEVRSQGYGLTLQQASKVIDGFGILSLDQGIISTRHVVHKTDGEIVGEWGMRKWLNKEPKSTSKRSNIHIARQALRLALIEQLGGQNEIQWGHQLTDFKNLEKEGVELIFDVKGQTKTIKVDVLVGADGIRSAVRNKLIGEEKTPLRYLDCIVILGICSLASLDGIESTLLDSSTVFQTANGQERIYMMPYSSDSIMWQLSFPMTESEAKTLSAKGVKSLKEEACRRTQWHSPIPQIMAATNESLISGYPVYDRAILSSDVLEKGQNITLIGDAAHPMSPFKGQGANQALLDALSLARSLFLGCRPLSKWKENGIRKSVLSGFEKEMLQRSAVKVNDSALAAEFLHTEIALQKGNEPRGRRLKKEI